MMRKKFIILILFLFIFVSNIYAEETHFKNYGSTSSISDGGNNVSISGSTSIVNGCDSTNRSESFVEGLSSEYDYTYAYTYENLCTSVNTYTMYWCSEDMKMEMDCSGDAAFQSGGSTSMNDEDNNSTVAINNSDENESLISKISIPLVTDNNHYSIKKIVTGDTVVLKCVESCPQAETLGTGTGQVDYTGGTTETGEITCASVGADYWTDVIDYVTVTCRSEEMDCCAAGALINGTCSAAQYCYSEFSYYEKIDGKKLRNCSTTSCQDYNDLFDHSIAEAHCSDDDYYTHYEGASGEATCSDPVFRSSGSASKTVCENVGPAKVEAFNVKIWLNYTDSDNIQEAYCINPSLDYTEKTKWDTNFDSSKCVDSLHRRDDDGELVFDMECGYVYIITEAKRINEEYTNKGKEEPFSYTAISTAMRLFGTGITSGSLKLSDTFGGDSGSYEFLMASGYYYTYAAWGGPYEFVAIPFVRSPDVDVSSFPAIYQFFMPEFYSIYIRSANAVEKYLKDGVRLEDVGNVECSNNDASCIDGKDGKKYIVDAEYYLSHLTCSTPTSCSQSVLDLIYNDTIASGRRSSKRFDASVLPPNYGQVSYYLQSELAKKSSCSGGSGMGVFCGDFDNNSDYIDAIYLYIRAMQGNKVLYPQSVENYINEHKYTPIEGDTRVITSTRYNEVTKQYETIYTLRYTIDKSSYSEDTVINCTSDDPECSISAYIFTYNGEQVVDSEYHDAYDYCKKNYCYIEVKGTKVCETENSQYTVKSVIVSEPDIKVNLIKKIGNGGEDQQTLYVYDPELAVKSDVCDEVTSVYSENKITCPCKYDEKANVLEKNGNINDVNYCSNNYNTYDELYYGDPSMSSIINACDITAAEVYDYTDDLNINANDLVRDGEESTKLYGYQMEEDDFDFCKLYCRDEARVYLANKTAVRAGMYLKYDIGSVLLNKKIINETGSKILSRDEFNNNARLKYVYGDYESYVDAKNETNKTYYGTENVAFTYSSTDSNDSYYNFSPIVVLQFKECTSIFDYDKWTSLYNSANSRAKKQLIYGAYNCNLYSTADIEKEANGLLSDIYDTGSSLKSKSNNSNNTGYPEPAMIEYSYDISNHETTVTKNWGTTKDYLLAEEQKACESVGLKKDECGIYNVLQYEDDFYYSKYGSNTRTYINSLAVNNEKSYEIDSNMGLVDSNLNKTIYCNGDSCYKICVSYDINNNCTGYKYNPGATSSNKYTVQTGYTKNGTTYKTSGNMISEEYLKKNNLDSTGTYYGDWGAYYNYFTIGSSNDKHTTVGGYNIPINQYSSMVVVTEFEFYNKTVYYADAYTGIISLHEKKYTSGMSSSVALDKNVYPLHLEISPGTYSFEAEFSQLRTNYWRNQYYIEKNYKITDDRDYENGMKLFSSDEKWYSPYSFKYICTYDVDNITTGPPSDSGGNKGYTYRMVDLNEVFVSVTNEDGTGTHVRNYPENWNIEENEIAEHVLAEIENSSELILEIEGDNDTDDSYLEYSFTLTKEGIKKIRQYNDQEEDNGGYLNETTYDCEYDSEQEIFIHCKSDFIENVIGSSTFASAFSGNDLVINNKICPNGETSCNGVSEFCNNSNNKNEDYCKY